MKIPIFDFSVLKDKIFLTGLTFYAFSVLAYFSAINNSTFREEDVIFFVFINLLLFLIYFITLGVNNRKLTGRFWKFHDIRKNILLLLILNSSAYTLNIGLPVFEPSVDWLQGLLVLMNIALLTFCFRPRPLRPDAINFGISGIMSLGLILSVYGSIYIIPLYGISIMAIWFFGLTLHTFVPLWLSILSFKIIRQYTKVSSTYRNFALFTITIPLLYLIFFIAKWNAVNNNIQSVISNNTFTNEQVLPDWVAISQKIDNGWATEKILKSDILYSTVEPSDIFTIEPSHLNVGVRRGWNNQDVRHDPFVILASLINGKIKINHKDRERILRAMYVGRHENEDRLWSGSNLTTDSVETSVQLFPEHRLSYTEKVFVIKNNLMKNQRWGSTQEAIYSFYLPEGAVVTSASLWVNGIEQKSYLTTREKANNAYKTIVGRERRDPLLLHWQEGNRISVRVFPCTPKEDRRFKIGITAPLKKEDDQLVFQNITLDGPSWKNAKETIKIYKEGEVKNLDIPFRTKEKENYSIFSGNYHQDWSMTMDIPPLAYSSFSFNGKNLRANNLLELTKSFDPENIYLDINNSWSKRQCNKIWFANQDKNVYVFTNKIEKVTTENYRNLFAKARKNRFSLFPFYKMENSVNSLVITQGEQYTPTLKDLDKSFFSKDLKLHFAANDSPIRIFNLGKNTTPYLKSIKEFKIFNFQNGNLNQLLEQLSNKSFPEYQHKENVVVIPSSGIVIKTDEGERNINNAPDHLLRLFAYNDIMKRIGKNYYNLNYIQNDLIQDAKSAYVVTPISSLVTLETQHDYDRFNIKEAKNSLKNASIKGSGSVPEPHEWVLIILCLATLLFLKFRA